MLIFFTILLIACEDEATLSISPVNNVNADVQSVIDMTPDDKFASLIYSSDNTSYVILNTQGEVNVSMNKVDSNIQIMIDHAKNDGASVITTVYEFTLDEQYERILLFENGKEIPFEIWTE